MALIFGICRIILPLMKSNRRAQTEVDKFGRIVVPKSLRSELGLVPGKTVRFTKVKDGILLSLRSEEPLVVNRQGVLVCTSESEGDMNEALEELRNERLEALWSRNRK